MIDARLMHNPGRSTMMAIMAIAALALALALSSAHLMAQEEPGAMPGLTLTSENPGELVISWNGPEPAPSDYRISWAPTSKGHISWQDDNEADRGNAYPQGTERSHTVTGLPAGEDYKVRMRARYNAGQYADNPWSGPWEKATITLAQEPEPEPAPTPVPTPPAPTQEPVEETTPPTTTLSATTPVVGKPLTATLVDPDALVSGESWSWSSSTTITGTFTAIAGAASAIYTPTVEDLGSYLRATASYSDESESDQSVSVDSTDATIANPSPTFTDVFVTFSVMENLTTGEVGTVTATDPDNDTLTYSVDGTDTVEFDGDFSLNVSSGAITVKSDAAIDYESKSSYTVTITATDTFGGTDTIEVTITVDEAVIEEPAVVGASIQTLTIVDTAEPEQISVSWVGPTGPAADRFQIAWTFEGMEYTQSRDRNVTTQEEEFTITGISELTAYAIRVRAHFETEEDGVYTYGPWIEQIHTTAALPAATPEPIVTAPAPVREASEDHTTGLIPLVSNSGLPGTTGSMWVNSQTTVSQKFRTGSAQQGYTLNEVELELTPKAGNAAVTLSVHASSGPSYGARLFELTPPADLDADVDVFKAPANSVLQPNTEYWLVIGTTADSAGDVNLVLSDSDATDDTTLEGFSLLQMNIDVDAPGLTLPITGSLTDALGALGGGGASSGGSGTRGSPSTSTSTNVIRMVINGHHVGDVPAGITTQAGLTLGEVRTGYTNFKNDADWYRVELKAGVRYVFDAYLKDPYKPDSVRLYGIYNNSSPDPMSMSIEYVHRYLLRDYAIEGSSTARAEFNPWGRAYFTPSADGTFFVAAGVRQTHTANYQVKYDEADTETEDTATPAIAATGINSPYHGEFFTPNGTLTESADYDVDWIRVSLQAGENYQFLVDVPYIYTKVDINAVYDSAGVIVPDFVPGTSQRTKDERGFWPNHSWAIAHFQPAATGDYYVEITGSSAERHDGVTTTAGVKSAIYVTDAYFGSQYTFYLTGTGQPNADESETATDTLGHGNVFVDGFIDTDNSSVSGRIDARGDVDWYRVWFDEGEQYMIFLDDEGDSDVRLAGIWEWPTVYLDNSFDRNFSYTSVEARTEITTKCGFAVVRAEETGFHFIELTSSKQGEYAMSVFPLDDRPTTDEMTLGGDVGRCVHPGFLFSGDAATGTFQQAGEWDTYAVWFRVGVEYQIEARGSSSGSGTATDPVMYIQDSTGNADSSGFNKGTGNDDLWNKVANRWDLHLIHVSGNHSVAGHTYSIGFEEIGVVNEPDFADFMPDGNPRAGYLATGQVLRGNLSPGDQYDGFRIVTKPGKSYSVSAQAVNIKNWARNNMSNYDDMYLIVRRFDGTNYVVVDSSVDDGYIVKDRYRDSGIHLHFEAEEPPTGVTYEYLGEIRAWNEAQQLYVGGYTISLREDDRRRIFNAEDYPAESAETLVDQGFVLGNIETAGDYDSFVFNLVSGKEYQIGVRSDHSSDGRTIDNIVADSLKWISGVGSQKTTGGLDSAALVVAGDSSNGEFIMTYTPTISGLYILTVNSADGNTGTYTVQIKDVTPISIPGPIGKAIVGQELSFGDLTKLETDLGETPTYTSYQWLRDGIAIPGATGTTYTLVGDTVVEATALIPAAGAIPAVPATYKTVFADSGHRISIRITYALADTSTGRAKSVATSHVIGVNLKLIGRLDQGGNVTQTGNNERATIWHGFTTGNNPNGYVIDRVLIHSATVPRFGNRISKDLIKSFVEGTGNLGTYDPTAGDRKFELFPDGDYVKGGDITYHSSTAGNHLEPNKKHNVSIRESSEDYSWYCQVPLDVGAVDAGLQPGWEVRPTVVINSEPEATVKEFAISGACKFGIFGRVLGTDAARLTNLDITNTPAGDIGYNLGGTVQVTATFSKPVTGTFSMAINIGDRVAVAEATGVNNNTVIFEFTILETDSDDNGINFDENALHGYADADLGHNNLEADVNNRIVTASQGPIGRAAIGGVLTANPLSEFATSRGETHTGHTYQWLRDGEEIPGATGDTYTLIGADSGKRMSTRVSYMVGGSARSVNSNATPYVAGESIMLVGNTERNPSSGWPNPGDSAVQWVSFIAGTNPNGYLLDRMRVMYHEHTDFAAEFPISEYKAAIELARNDGVPMADSEIAELLVEGPIRRGESGYFQAPPVIHLDRNTRYNLALREYNTGHSSCKTANQDQYNANGRQPGWKIRSRVEGHTDPDSMVTEHNFLRPCASEFHGHVINPDAVAYLTALGIVNTPEDGDGFESGDIVEVTAVLSEAITGTFSMSINIGRRTATATATGVDTDTFVFSYTISGSDDDIDGITFDEHSIQFNGWLALDLGHNDLWPIAENKVVPFILGDGPMGKAVEGETLTIGDLSELATFLGETPTSYSYQWLRDGVVIPGETGNTYTLIDADSGYRISVLTTYTLADSSTEVDPKIRTGG